MKKGKKENMKRETKTKKTKIIGNETLEKKRPKKENGRWTRLK